MESSTPTTFSRPPQDYPVFALTDDDVDDQTPGVLLLRIEPEGDAKTTARDQGDSWWVQEWETKIIGETTYWFPTDGYRLDKAMVMCLAQAQLVRKDS